MEPAKPGPPVARFGADSTLRWSCRKGDFLLWLAPKGGMMDLLAAPKDAWTMPDFWEMRDGDFVTITNRLADLPPWFQLHPTEAFNALAYAMAEKLNKGWEPGEIMSGPNLWRPKAGDRLAWVGLPRAGMNDVDGVLCILDLQECALVIGESSRDPAEGSHVAPDAAGLAWADGLPGVKSMADALGFGSLSTPRPTPETVALWRRAVACVRDMGTPDTFTEQWGLG